MSIGNTHVISLIAATLTTLGGCASTYKPSSNSSNDVGYSEKLISEGVYWLRFNGIPNEKVDNLLVHWNTRASELCGANNYNGTPQKKQNEETQMLYSMGVMYPNKVIRPYIEGRVTCIDKKQAASVAPSQYHPTGMFTRLRLRAVSAPGIDSGEKVSENFKGYLSDVLKRYQTELIEPTKYQMDIVITKYVADGWSNAWLMGGMSGGTYIMTSAIRIINMDSGNVIDDHTIETKVRAGGESAYRLKNEHAREIIEHVISIFSEKS